MTLPLTPIAAAQSRLNEQAADDIAIDLGYAAALANRLYRGEESYTGTPSHVVDNLPIDMKVYTHITNAVAAIQQRSKLKDFQKRMVTLKETSPEIIADVKKIELFDGVYSTKQRITHLVGEDGFADLQEKFPDITLYDFNLEFIEGDEQLVKDNITEHDCIDPFQVEKQELPHIENEDQKTKNRY